MEGFWPIFFLLVVLKVRVLGALWLVWWASQPAPEPDVSEDPGDGFRRWRPGGIRPRGPRRGPHGGAAQALPECPGDGRTRAARPPGAARPGLVHARNGPRRDHSRAPS